MISFTINSESDWQILIDCISKNYYWDEDITQSLLHKLWCIDHEIKGVKYIISIDNTTYIIIHVKSDDDTMICDYPIQEINSNNNNVAGDDKTSKTDNGCVAVQHNEHFWSFNMRYLVGLTALAVGGFALGMVMRRLKLHKNVDV